MLVALVDESASVVAFFASLFCLAQDTGVTRVMTTDVRDFSRYRLPDGRAFEIL